MIGNLFENLSKKIIKKKIKSWWLIGACLFSIMGNMGTFNKSLSQILAEYELMYDILLLILAIIGLTMHPFFYSALLFDVVKREETLQNVINSVTKNIRSILLTFMFAAILVYVFAIMGYVLFQGNVYRKKELFYTISKKILYLN